MKFKHISLVIALLAITYSSYAQYSQDALRFSRFGPGSTSRIKAIGNASTAVGGDMSSIGGNPAGLGFFNKSEFSFTPEYNGSEITSTYFGQTDLETRDQFNLNNASIVFHSPQVRGRGTDPTTGLLSVNFGVGYNRTNNFYDKTFYGEINPNSSIADFYADIANTQGFVNLGQSGGNVLAGWAADQGLIDSVTSDAIGTLYGATTSLNNRQNFTQVTSGGQNEFNLALGANYSNKLYLGFSLGLTSLRYESSSTFQETDGSDNDYRTFYDMDQTTTGSGFNFKLGMIYKPVEAVRLGASFTSPTWYTIEDNTSLNMETFYTQGNSPAANYDNFPTNYNLRTPLKVSGGIAVFMNQFGFISADVEYVDYSTINVSGYDNDSGDNENIDNQYQAAVNARVGAEAKLDKIYLRGGFNYQGNPEKNIGGATNTVSGGIGYRINNVYIDATYAHVSSKQTVFGYEFDPGSTTNIYGDEIYSPEANQKRIYNNAYLTVGFRF
ncbi:OmpP1/FadL family transporter [Arcticibacter svalbardensis]|uniref:OmpP1/FadL family transporter n=1 Tax=Arcticibacter svalbardensis TaxID=1288027 RepID=UPI0012685376|nr:hypothetical protein [Arcticibacter svalbardensis]